MFYTIVFNWAPFPSYQPIRVVGVKKNELETSIHKLVSTIFSRVLAYFLKQLKCCLMFISIIKFKLFFFTLPLI